jgi:hypothetical protein
MATSLGVLRHASLLRHESGPGLGREKRAAALPISLDITDTLNYIPLYLMGGDVWRESSL